MKGAAALLVFIIAGCAGPSTRATRERQALDSARELARYDLPCERDIKAGIAASSGSVGVDLAVGVSGCGHSRIYRMFCSGLGCRLLVPRGEAPRGTADEGE